MISPIWKELEKTLTGSQRFERTCQVRVAMLPEGSPVENINEKIIRRCEMLRGAYDLFAETLDVCDEVYLCDHALTELVVNYFFEIEAYKQKHSFEKADRHKQAAFTFRWITKTRPVQIKEDVDVDFELLIVNEWFAVWAAMIFLEIENLDDCPMVTVIDLLNISSRSHYFPELGGLVFYLFEKVAE